MQLVALIYKRKDGGEDPIEWSNQSGKQSSSAATTAFSVLRRARRIPGTKQDGSIDAIALRIWIDDVRALGAHARADRMHRCCHR